MNSFLYEEMSTVFLAIAKYIVYLHRNSSNDKPLKIGSIEK